MKTSVVHMKGFYQSQVIDGESKKLISNRGLLFDLSDLNSDAERKKEIESLECPNIPIKEGFKFILYFDDILTHSCPDKISIINEDMMENFLIKNNKTWEQVISILEEYDVVSIEAIKDLIGVSSYFGPIDEFIDTDESLRYTLVDGELYKKEVWKPEKVKTLPAKTYEKTVNDLFKTNQGKGTEFSVETNDVVPYDEEILPKRMVGICPSCDHFPFLSDGRFKLYPICPIVNMDPKRKFDEIYVRTLLDGWTDCANWNKEIIPGRDMWTVKDDAVISKDRLSKMIRDISELGIEVPEKFNDILITKEFSYITGYESRKQKTNDFMSNYWENASETTKKWELSKIESNLHKWYKSHWYNLPREIRIGLLYVLIITNPRSKIDVEFTL